MRTKALAGWYGANRMLAETVGRELHGCHWVGIPFAGGMSELACIGARTVIVNDLHAHIINLAKVAAHPTLGPKLYRELKRAAFHPDELREAQDSCKAREALDNDADELFAQGFGHPVLDGPNLAWAIEYFKSCWMSHGGKAGTKSEFKGSYSFRWDAGGGDSATRYFSAIASLVDWRRIMRRCTFLRLDAFEFLDSVKDQDGHGLYVDANWPDDGDCYKHTISDAGQSKLAERLRTFKKTRVVIRFGVHPLIAELYPRHTWHWLEQSSRAQSNRKLPEALILNGPPMAKEAA